MKQVHRPIKNIYVASSWRNPMQTAVVHALNSANRQQDKGWNVYDFKDDANQGDAAFHWTDVIPGYDDGTLTIENYLAGLESDRAYVGFQRDMRALDKADTTILVLPCGRSAHLELGFAVGAGHNTAVLLDEPVTAELMYKMVDYLSPSLFDLLGWLGVED